MKYVHVGALLIAGIINGGNKDGNAGCGMSMNVDLFTKYINIISLLCRRPPNEGHFNADIISDTLYLLNESPP